MKDLLLCVHVVVKTKLKFGKFTLSFGRLKCVQHDYFSSFNQSDHCFLAWSLPLRRPCLSSLVLTLTVTFRMLPTMHHASHHALKRVRPFISTDVAVQIYNALILPHFDYCSPVWDCMSGYLSDKLQKLQNRAARVITKSPFDTSSNLLLAMLKWKKLSLRRKKTESSNYV